MDAATCDADVPVLTALILSRMPASESPVVMVTDFPATRNVPLRPSADVVSAKLLLPSFSAAAVDSTSARYAPGTAPVDPVAERMVRPAVVVPFDETLKRSKLRRAGARLDG